jgi:hypothetical protein
MRLFLGNFDFEHHLAPAGPRALSAQIRRLNHEMAFCLVPLAEPGDCIWAPELPDSDFATHLEELGLPPLRFVSQANDLPDAELVPWGWCESVKKWGAKHGCRIDAPDFGAVARANSREFSSALEAEWAVGLPGARTIRTREELDQALSEASQLPHGGVIKANFGMSARERILIRPQSARAQDVEWARRRIERGESLFFEPWVEAVAQFGCQLSVPREASPRWEGVTQLFTDIHGTYRGSSIESDCASPGVRQLPPNVFETVERAAHRVSELGYFGPLGIDVMQYRTSTGEIGWRPLQDINVRLTMGRAALRWRRVLSPGESAVWLHLRRSAGGTSDLEALIAPARLPPGVRVVRTSPLEVGGKHTSHPTALVIAQSPDALNAALSAIGAVHGDSPL